jgi:hypothetical protein
MGRDRHFRGGMDGHCRPFDWLALARQHGVPEQEARSLYEEAVRQAGGHREPRLHDESIYRELLADARRRAWRPSPGKVTRTMRLQAHRAGKRRGPHVSHLTGQPIAPGKRTLTSYIEPAVHESRAQIEARERLETDAPSFLALGATVPADLQTARARPSEQEISIPGTAAHREFQANLAAAFGYFEALDALKEEHLDAEPGADPLGVSSPFHEPGAYRAAVAELGSSLGVSPIVDASPAGASTAQAHGASAVTIGSTIYVDPAAVDPATPGGRDVIAHEVVHVAQDRRGTLRWGRDAAEDEAHHIGSQLTARAKPDPVRMALASGAAAAWQPPGETTSQHQLSPDGFVVSGQRLHVERVWYQRRYLLHSVDCNRQILERLGEHAMPWIRQLTPAEFERAAKEIWLGPSGEQPLHFQTGQDTAFVPVFHILYLVIGLPPDTVFMWEFPIGGQRPLPPNAPQGATPPPGRLARLFVRGSEIQMATPERPFSTGLLTQILDRLEANCGRLLPGRREQILASGNLAPSLIMHAALFTFTREHMVSLFGEASWSAFERSHAADGATPGSSEQSGNVSVDPQVSQAEQEFARRMLEEIGSSSDDGPPIVVNAALLAVLHEIDQHLQRARVIERLRSGGGSTASSADEATRLRQVMNSVDMGEEYERLGITPPAGTPREREFPWQVQGRIINHTDLLFVNKEASFSFDVTSRERPPLMMFPPWVHVHWVVRAINSRETSPPTIADGRTLHRPHLDAPDKFTVSFDQVGTYEIDALVDHDHFAPNHFTIFVQVETEQARFQEVQDRAFTPGLWGAETADERDHEFLGTSGTDVYDTGRLYTGRMGDTSAIPNHLDGLDRQIEQMRRYIASGRVGPDERQWATEYLRTMEATRAQIQGETRGGAHLLFVQGAYLSRAEGASSQALEVVAHAQREGRLWRVTIHDATQAFDTRNSRFSETHEHMAGAAETAFSKLAKSYPRGLMSLRMELLDDLTGQPTRRYIGFELECNSTWESVRSVLYHPAVSAVINIAGAVATIFAPPMGAWIIPTLIAYNSVDTVSGMMDLGARDALHWDDALIGVGQIAIDVIPYVGQARELVRVGTTVFRVMEGLEIAGEMVLMTAQLSEQVQTLRFGVMRQAAELQADIQRREATNRSDPALPQLRQELAQLEARARQAWKREIGQTAIRQGMMRAPTHVARQIHAAHTARIDQSRSRLEQASQGRGRQQATDADLPHLSTVMGVPVTRGGEGNGVHIEYVVGTFGGIRDVRVVAGRGASLDMIMHHQRTVAAMRRYAGITGSVQNLLERIQAFVRGGVHIAPRAFEARFELEKLPPIIRSLEGQLNGIPLTDASRAHIEQQIAHLEGQLQEHARYLDDVAPGLGYVAAQDTSAPTAPLHTDSDPAAVMGDRPGSTPHPHTPGTAPPTASLTDVPPPSGRTPAEHARLATQRGGASLNLVNRASGWTGAREAAFRYGDRAAALIPDGYHWSTDGSGHPVMVRDRVDSAGQPVPRRTFNPAMAEQAAQVHGPITREMFEQMFPLRDDSIERAAYRSGPGTIETGAAGHTVSQETRAEMERIAHQRDNEIQSRGRLEGDLARQAQALNVSDEDLSSARFEATLARLRTQHADNPTMLRQIDDLERTRRGLATARSTINRASEQLGNQMAMDFVESTQQGARPVYGDPSTPGRLGEFDFVYVVRNDAGEITRVLVVEAKGGSSTLGTRNVDGSNRQQGTAAYMRAIADRMLNSAVDPDLRQALDAISNHGPASGGPEVRYILVEAPVDAAGMPRPGRVSEFQI